MAYGGFTGYQDDPNTGLTSFQRENGPPISAFGPSAADLKARIDAAQQFAPVAVAANGPALAASGVPADYERESEDRVASALDATPAPVAASAPNMSVAPPLGPANVSTAQGEPAPAPTAQPAAAEQPRGVATPLLFDPKTKQTIYLRPGGDRNNPADLFTMAPATRGSPGGFQPSSIKISDANTAATPNDLEALREGSIDQKLAYQQAYDLHAETLAEQRAALDAQADANRIAQQEAQARVAQVQAKTNQLQLQYDQAKQDYNSSKVDPQRYMRGVAGIGNALAMGLGAYGAAITKSPNFAANFVNQQIQADIAAQEAAIRIKGAAANTALGDLQRQFGSLDLAKAAYGGAVLQEQKRKLDVLANNASTREAAANYLQGAAQLDAALQANDLAFRQAAAGHVEKTLTYRAPTSGTVGGPRPVTGDQFADASKGAPKGTTHKAEEKAAVVQDAVAAADEAGAAAGLVWDPKKREYVEGPSGSNALVGSSGLATEARQQAHGIISANAGKFAHALGERPPSVDMVDRYAGEFFTNGPQGVLHYKSRLSALRRNLDRSAGHAGSLPDTPEERAEDRGEE